MDNLNDLRAIWLTADTKSLPAADEIVRFVKKYRNQKLRKKVLLIAFAFLFTAIEVAVGFTYHSTLLTTRLGEALVILAGIILIATNINSLNRMYKLKDLSNKEFIAFFERTRQRQHFYHTKTQVVCIGLCFVGLLLYMYESVYQHMVAAVVVYAVSVLYFLFLAFFIRPRTYKRQTKKMDAIMEQLTTLSKQLDEE